LGVFRLLLVQGVHKSDIIQDRASSIARHELGQHSDHSFDELVTLLDATVEISVLSNPNERQITLHAIL
jgi:hypothetical protein